MKDVIALLTFILIVSVLCAVNSHGNFDNFVCPLNCYCNISNPSVNRHEIACPSQRPQAEIGLYETVTNHDFSVSARCYNQDQYVYEILSKFDMTSAKQAFFYECSLPDGGGDPFGSATTMKQLTNLSFLRGNLTSLPAEYFDELIDLEELDLSNNQLSIFPDGFFGKFTKLRKLNLNHNHFKSLADVMTRKPASLRSLDVSNNLIEDITKRDLEIYDRDIFVDVGNNLIQYVSATPFVVPKRYKQDVGFFDLAGNPFDCSCRAQDFIGLIKIWSDYVPFFSISLKCATPEKHAGSYVWQFTKESVCEV